MNKTEAAYAEILEAQLRRGEIAEWRFEEVKVCVGIERSWYTPDFWVRHLDGSTQFIEVKGRKVWDGAREKFQAAAKQHRWARWTWAQRDGREWRTVYDYPAAVAA